VSERADEEGIPDPNEYPPGVDEEIAEDGMMLPGDFARGAGHFGETAAEQRQGAPLRRPPARPSSGLDDVVEDPEGPQLVGEDGDAFTADLSDDRGGLSPEERAMEVVEEDLLDGDPTAARRGMEEEI